MKTPNDILEECRQKHHQGGSVNLDWLSFSFSISNLRHLSGAVDPESSPKVLPYFPSIDAPKYNYSACDYQFKFPVEPRYECQRVGGEEELAAYNKYIRNEFVAYYEDSLKVFVSHVLGLSLSAPLDKPFHFYENSFNLISNDGEQFCGKVGIGGNNNTVHFQISGTGCKHVLARRSLFSLHHYLSNVLGITKLSRVDIAYDDYDGIFDCEYALKAAYEDAFRVNPRGRSPVVDDQRKFHFGESFNDRQFEKEQISIGSRQSPVYWRIYNKALEQKVTDIGVTWYRSEVELKKWDIDILLNLAGGFAALNDFARSIESSKPFSAKRSPYKRPVLDLLTSTFWLRRQYGKLLNDLVLFFDGDLDKVISSVSRGGHKLGFPSTYKKLVYSALEY